MSQYGEAMKIAEGKMPWLLESRNDIIATNLYGTWAKTKDDIRAYLAQQWGFSSATAIDRQNTVESIAARMGITKDTLSVEDQLMNDADAELNELKLEKDKSLLWKEIDHVSGEDVRELSDSELQPLADKLGMTLEDARAYEQERLASLQEYKRPYDEAVAQQELDKARGIEDADTALQRALDTNENNISDVTRDATRAIQSSEMIWALKWYNQSELRRQGLTSIQTDADELLRRIRVDMQNDTDDTLKYKTRLSEDFVTSMDTLNADWKSSMQDERLRGTNTINTLLEKYSPSEDILTDELNKFAKEFGMRGSEIMQRYVSMYKEITNDAYEKEAQIANINNIYSQIAAREAAMSESPSGTLTTAEISSLLKMRDNPEASDETIAWVNSMLGIWSQQSQYDQKPYTPVTQSTLNNAMGTLLQSSNDPNAITNQSLQCWAWVNDRLQSFGVSDVNMFVDPINAKTAQTNSDTATIGSVAVFDFNNDYGHVGIVTKVDGNGNPTEIADWNWGSDEKYSVHNIDANQQSAITWYFDPTKAQQTQETQYEEHNWITLWPQYEVLSASNKSIVKWLLDYKISLPPRNKEYNNIIWATMEANSEWSDVTYKERYDFKKVWNKSLIWWWNLSKVATAVQHLWELEKLWNELEWQSNIQVKNKITNRAKWALGDPKITSYEVAVSAVVSELAGAYKGNASASEADVKAFRDDVWIELSPKQMLAFVNEAAHLLFGKINTEAEWYYWVMWTEPLSIFTQDWRDYLLSKWLNVDYYFKSPERSWVVDIDTQWEITQPETWEWTIQSVPTSPYSRRQ